MKKIGIVIIIIAIVIGYIVIHKDQQNEITVPVQETNQILILYFSATGNTEQIAQYIQKATEGDLIEIEPQVAYSLDELDYTNDESRANQE